MFYVLLDYVSEGRRFLGDDREDYGYETIDEAIKSAEAHGGDAPFLIVQFVDQPADSSQEP